MEKFSQFRDRGSGIAPFLPVPAEPSGVYAPFHAFLFLIRLTCLVMLTLTYVLVVQWLPIGSLGTKAFLWSIFGISGLWWIDLQIDGVRRGALAHNSDRLPGPGTIIAASFTSPLDVLYLAALFDPIFTVSQPRSFLVKQLSLISAVLQAFAPPPDAASGPTTGKAGFVDLLSVMREYPGRPIVVFPECTTTNGRGILPFAPSLLGAPRRTPIFPVSLRYTAADVTTPVPGTYGTFLWNFLSQPSHCIRVRIARSEANTRGSGGGEKDDKGPSDLPLGAQDEEEERRRQLEDRKLLDRVADALARLGRMQRVGLGVKEKRAFVKAWTKNRQQ